jgi:GNAT superfamily N-acetyltransferase
VPKDSSSLGCFFQRLSPESRRRRFFSASLAEVAFAVDDAFQHQGLGTLLLRRLASLAVQHGFTRFWAVTQADNQTMHDVFLESGFALEEKTQGSEVEVHLALVASPTRVT